MRNKLIYSSSCHLCNSCHHVFIMSLSEKRDCESHLSGKRQENYYIRPLQEGKEGIITWNWGTRTMRDKNVIIVSRGKRLRKHKIMSDIKTNGIREWLAKTCTVVLSWRRFIRKKMKSEDHSFLFKSHLLLYLLTHFNLICCVRKDSKKVGDEGSSPSSAWVTLTPSTLFKSVEVSYSEFFYHLKEVTQVLLRSVNQTEVEMLSVALLVLYNPDNCIRLRREKFRENSSQEWVKWRNTIPRNPFNSSRITDSLEGSQ